MSNDLSAEQASRLIGLIYESVVDPNLWQDAVDTVRRELGFANAALNLFALPSGRILLNVASGIPPEWLARMPDLAQDNVALWGGPKRMMSFPLGEPVVSSEIVGPEVIASNKYYTDWARPQGLVDAVVIPVAREQNLVGGVGWGVKQPVSESQRQLLRLLGPHFRRAVSIANLLSMNGLTLGSLEAALDAFLLGIVLVDADLKIHHANVAATAMLRDNDPISHAGGRLSLPHPRSTEALADAVHRAAISGIALGQRGIGIPTRRRDGSPALVHVMPLGGWRRPSNTLTSAVAAVFIASTTTPPQMPAAADLPNFFGPRLA